MIKLIKNVACSFISLAAVMVYLAGTVGIFPYELGQWLYEEEARWAVGAMASSALGYFLAYVLLFKLPLCRKLQSVRGQNSK